MQMRQRAHKGLKVVLAGLLGCLCMVGWLASVEATSVIQLSEAQMVEMSSLVVRGKVVSQRYVKGPNGMGVVTLVTIQVLEEVLGRPAPKQVIVRHFGGKIGQQEIKMIGGPKFTNGNEVLVFLQVSKYLPKGEYLLVGLTQGKWIIHRADPQAGSTGTNGKQATQSVEPVVVRSLQGLKMYNNNGQPLKPHNHAGHAGHNHAVQADRHTLSVMVKRLRGHWSAIQKRGKNKVLKLPAAAASPKKPKVVLPKTKIQTVKSLKVVKPQVRTPARTPAPKKQQ